MNELSLPDPVKKVTNIVIESGSGSIIDRCGRCLGTGENNREYKCHVCKGTGKVRLDVPPDLDCTNIGVLECGRCHGTGENNREYFCRICEGVGSLVKCFPRVVCERCNGSGENNSEYFCGVCDGCGSIWLENIPPK